MNHKMYRRVLIAVIGYIIISITDFMILYSKMNKLKDSLKLLSDWVCSNNFDLEYYVQYSQLVDDVALFHTIYAFFRVGMLWLIASIFLIVVLCIVSYITERKRGKENE